MKKKWLITVIVSVTAILAVSLIWTHHQSASTAGLITPQPTATSGQTPLPTSHSNATPTPTRTPLASAKPVVKACSASDLALNISTDGAAAGTAYYRILLSSTTNCTLYGFPGVSLLDASGHQLGQPATRDTSKHPSTVTVTANAPVQAVFSMPNPGNFDPGTCTAQATKIRVYAPNTSTPLLASFHEQACPGWQVGPVQADTGQTGQPYK